MKIKEYKICEIKYNCIAGHVSYTYKDKYSCDSIMEALDMLKYMYQTNKILINIVN